MCGRWTVLGALLAALTALVALGAAEGAATSTTGLCRALQTLVNAVDQLLADGILCPVLRNNAICQGINATIINLRRGLVDYSLCYIVGGRHSPLVY
ncbi:hypothetical protein R5R35_006429 [Gryllus longicercus]|uniref:Accessory gland protein n=1 Tax=Gryllus longicercus TaxID=2509291 RepID=A0AAN9ZFC8_9ORTH